VAIITAAAPFSNEFPYFEIGNRVLDYFGIDWYSLVAKINFKPGFYSGRRGTILKLSVVKSLGLYP
jgi:hypothetical protein